MPLKQATSMDAISHAHYFHIRTHPHDHNLQETRLTQNKTHHKKPTHLTGTMADPFDAAL